MQVNGRNLDEHELDRLIGMAWEDRTPFEAIEVQFGLKENEVRALMRRHLKPGSFRRWRARVKGRSTKHARLRGFSTGRFRSRQVLRWQGQTSSLTNLERLWHPFGKKTLFY